MRTEQIMIMAAFAILTAASVRDMKKREVATWMMGAAFLVSAIACLIRTGTASGTEILLAAGVSLLPGFALLAMAALFRDKMGFGDGLMALFFGPAFGVQRMVTGLFLAFFFSAIVSLVLIALKKAGRKSTIPFLPFLTAGMGVMQLVS